MTKICSIFVQLLFVVLVSLASCTQAGAAANMAPGEEAFETQCSACHPKGENIITPAKTLHKKDLEKSGILTAADIVGKMRNPGPAMTKFDEATVPDKTARTIAEYILKTFK